MKDIVQDLVCPISRETFSHPLILADGFSYEESFIKKWKVEHDISPMTGAELENKELRENATLMLYIIAYRGLNQRLIKKRTRIKQEEAKLKEIPLTITLNKEYKKALDHYYKSTMELDKCCNIIAELYNSAPNNFQVATDYANILRFSMRFDDCFNIIKVLKKLRPESLIPDYIKIRVLMEKGDEDQGIKDLSKVQVENRIEDHTLLETRFLSYPLLSAGNREHSYKIISAYLDVAPKDHRAFSHLIYLKLLKKDYKSVIKIAKKYLKSYQNDVSILFHLAEAYTSLGKKNKAILVYKKIIALSADKTIRAKALYESATIRDGNRDFVEMIKELEESHKLDPGEGADRYLAAVYSDENMFDKAEEWVNACEKRVDVMSDEVILCMKAQIQENKNEFEKATSSYLRLAEIDNENYLYYNEKIEEILSKTREEK